MAIGPTEWILIVGVLLLLFGAAAIPKLARSLGKAQGEFQRARKDFQDEMHQGASESGQPRQDGGPTEEQVRRTARDLGIEEEGKSLDEVKRLLNERLG